MSTGISKCSCFFNDILHEQLPSGLNVHGVYDSLQCAPQHCIGIVFVLIGKVFRVTEAGHLSGNRQEKLELFESNNFDVEDFTNDFVVHLTEKGVNTLRGDLATLQEQCEEEVQKFLSNLHRMLHDVALQWRTCL